MGVFLMLHSVTIRVRNLDHVESEYLVLIHVSDVIYIVAVCCKMALQFASVLITNATEESWSLTTAKIDH